MTCREHSRATHAPGKRVAAGAGQKKKAPRSHALEKLEMESCNRKFCQEQRRFVITLLQRRRSFLHQYKRFRSLACNEKHIRTTRSSRLAERPSANSTG